jgi:hypothetical protein
VQPRQSYSDPEPRWAANELVVDHVAVAEVRSVLADHGIDVEETDQEIGPFRLILLVSQTGVPGDLVPAAIEALAPRILVEDPIAEPNYIHGCPQMRGGQFVVPDPLADRDVTFRPSPIGEGVRVVVLDTEYVNSPAIDGPSNTTLVPAALENPEVPGELAPAAGHATFVVGQILRVAPGATVEAIQVLDPLGNCSDWALAAKLAMIDNAPHLLNLSLGTFTVNDRIPKVLGHALQPIKDAGTVIVASAGNEDSSRPWFPAGAEDLTVAVGALVRLDGSWARAAYSNYGIWVDFCALGLLNGPYVVWAGQPQPYGGWAGWSGTSFSAPLVTGTLAALIGPNERPDDAVARLRASSPGAPGDFPKAQVVNPPLLWGENS